ncbi:mechanosensitive ion channel family protein [Flavobacterium sp. RNTU_13]|uniref:mechanosensitive ion channel family protein n=1 Tax=Flavobacterium sp. RNTU_13 TaxID=3375145 RepID=UPI003987956E
MKQTHTKLRYIKWLYTAVLLLSMQAALQAQLLPSAGGTEADKATTENPVYPPDSLNRRDPRGTVNGFIQAVADQNYIRASRYLNLKRNWRSNRQRTRIVTKFQKLLDQGGDMIPSSLISDKNEGRADDELAAGQDLVGTVTANGKEIKLYVENRGGDTEENPPLWQFSAETVAAISATGTDESSLLDIVLSDNLKERTLGGVPLGHWLAMVVLIVLSYIASWLLVALMGLVMRGIWKKARNPEKWLIIQALGLPLRLYISVLLFVEASQQVGISIIIRQRFSTITVTIGIAAILILLWRLTDIVSDFTKNRMTIRKRISAISVILFIRRMAKIAIIVIGIIALLGAIGFDVTTWIAALGIGGLALALGAQKTMENFVGSVSLIADQTIRVGDFCRVGDIKGTVESIGMRSTRLRTPQRTVVTIPNGQFASTNVENYAHRDRYLFNPTLELRMETTPDQLRYLLVEIRSMLYAHPSVNNDPAKVRFVGMSASGHKIEIFAYLEAISFDASQEVQEDVLLRILDIVAKSGSDFAYPSQTLYMAQDKGVDQEKTDKAKETVKKWREASELKLPFFRQEHIDELDGTINYPPEGSVGKQNDETKTDG